MIRSDIVINWETRPRIITILAPSTEVILQDLYDTIRALEDDPENMDDDYIASGSGKEPLGGGVYVGLTVTLNNAQVAFESRPGPEFVQCKIYGGNLVAFDKDGNTISPVHATPYTQVILTSSSSAIIIGVEPTSIRNAVWDASILNHQIPGTTGKTLSDIVKKIIPFFFAK